MADLVLPPFIDIENVRMPDLSNMPELPTGTPVILQWLKGDKGDPGERGIQGIQGIQGLSGVKGDKGEKGDKGDKGDAGVSNVPGVQGIQGIQGIPGVKGDKGDKGDTGFQGIQGIQGIPGVKGDKGDTGLQGIPGVKGDKGDTGLQGIQGVPGVDGSGDPSGWIAMTESTLTRNTDNIINVVTGALTRWEKWDKIKFTQHGVIKYGYVHLVTDTTIGFFAGNMNVVENTTTYPITDVCLSRVEKPKGFPTLFTYVPTLTGFSAIPTGCVYTFTIISGVCILDVYQDVLGTSNSTDFTISLPVKSKSVVGMRWSAPCMIADNGVSPAQPGLIIILPNSSVMTLYISYSGYLWTASGGKRCAVAHVTYPV